MRFSDRNTAGIEPKKWRLNNVKLDNSWGLKRKKNMVDDIGLGWYAPRLVGWAKSGRYPPVIRTWLATKLEKLKNKRKTMR